MLAHHRIKAFCWERALLFLIALAGLVCSSCLSGERAEEVTVSPKLPNPTHTIDPNFGSATGRIFVLVSGREVPLQNQILYLAGVIVNEQNQPSFAAFDRITSPRTTTDEAGRFRFVNVEPGSYGLVLDIITNSFLLMKPGTQEPIIVEITRGGVSDLGDLVYDELPVDVK